MPQTKIRRHGLPARASRGGSPKGSPPPRNTAPTLQGKTGITTWLELVDGPRGRNLAAPTRTAARRAELGQIVMHEPSKVEVPEGRGDRRERRIRHRAAGAEHEYHSRLHLPRRSAQSTIPPK